MHTLSLLALMFSSFLFDEVLVLRNGKKMVVERYEKQGSQLRVFAKGEVFMLPERMIDWAASEAEMERVAAAKAEKEAAAKKAAEKEKKRDFWSNLPNPDAPSREVVFTNRELREMTGNVKGPFNIELRRMGNSILVAAMINEQGPYDFVLDTGAEVTVLDPKVASSVGARMTGETARIVGVGGQPMEASIAKLDQISLNQARVDGLAVTLKSIPALNQFDIVGLLGQDFLNHFVVNLDANNNRLTLTRSARSSETASLHDKFRELPDPRMTMARLGEVQGSLDYLYRSFRSVEPQSQVPNELIQRIKQVNAEQLKISQDINMTYSFITETPPDWYSPEEKIKRQSFLNCRTQFTRYLMELQQFGQELSRAYTQISSAESKNRAQSRLDGALRQVWERSNDLNNCF